MHSISTLSQLAIGLSLTTALGVFVHDTKLDQATMKLLAPPAINHPDGAARSAKLAGDPHTHSERGSLSQAVRDVKGAHPRVQPRDDHKKFLLQKRVTKGVFAFDGYYMPLG